MADDQQLSPEEYKQLQDIAAQLPTGHPAQMKVAALLASQPTQFEKQQGAMANAEGPISRFARSTLRTSGLPESISDIPRWGSWFTGQEPGQEPWWQPQVNAYKNPTQENLVGAVPFFGPPSVAASRDVRSGNYAGALGDVAALPLSVRSGMEVRPGVSALKTRIAENLRNPDNTLTPSARLFGAGTGATAGALITPKHPYIGASIGGSIGGGLADFLVPNRNAPFESPSPGFYTDFPDVRPGDVSKISEGPFAPQHAVARAALRSGLKKASAPPPIVNATLDPFSGATSSAEAPSGALPMGSDMPFQPISKGAMTKTAPYTDVPGITSLKTSTPRSASDVGGEPSLDVNSQDLISRMKKIVKPGEEPSAADLKRAGDLTQASAARLRTLAKFGDRLAQNELNRRLKND